MSDILQQQKITVYYKSLTYIKDRIKFYKANQYEKGTIEAISWFENFKFVNKLSTFKQSKFNRRLTQLIVMTCNQDQIYKLHEFRSRYNDESLALKEFTNNMKLYLSGEQRRKKSEAVIINNRAQISESVYRSELNMALRKQEEIIEINNNERAWLRKATIEDKSKIEAKGMPTYEEILRHGKIFSKTDSQLNVSVTVTCKLYGYYWVMVNSRARYSISNKHYEISPYLTGEQAFKKAKELFNKEIVLQLDYNKKENDKAIKKEKEKQKMNIDISNVVRAMGIEESDNNIDTDIF